MAGALGGQGYGWFGHATGGSSGFSGSPWQFLGDPYQEKALKLQEDQQHFGQDAARAKFGLVQNLMPYAQQALQGLSGGGMVGGAPRPQPAVNTNPIFNPQQIQEQINSALSSNDSKTSNLMKQLGESAGARGFGGNSPAYDAMRTQLGIANMQEGSTAKREIPLHYAQANADQNFRVNQLQQQQWNQYEDSDIRRRQAQSQNLGQMLGWIGGLF